MIETTVWWTMIMQEILQMILYVLPFFCLLLLLEVRNEH